MALKQDGTGTARGYKIERFSDLSDADLSDADLRGADLGGANLRNTNLSGADLSGADLRDARFDGTIAEYTNFQNADLFSAKFNRANLLGANFQNKIIEMVDFVKCDLHNADFRHTTVQFCGFVESNLLNANFMGAKFRLSYATGEHMNSDTFIGAELLDTQLPPNAYPKSRSYGVMTGPILKLGKPDSPTKAVEFKRRYPSEFERLKADTGGADFTENLREKIRQTHLTPFDWIITKTKYNSDEQRTSPDPNIVILLNIFVYNELYTKKEQELLVKISNADARRPKHPFENLPLLTIGWVRYAKDDAHGVLLIEEVQSDIMAVRKRTVIGSPEADLLKRAGINEDEFDEVHRIIKPYADRIFADGVAFVFQEAEKLGYTVEMLPIELKNKKATRSTYTDLPKKLGMTARRTSESLPDLPAPVHYYKPNPGKPRRGF